MGCLLYLFLRYPSYKANLAKIASLPLKYTSTPLFDFPFPHSFFPLYVNPLEETKSFSTPLSRAPINAPTAILSVRIRGVPGSVKVSLNKPFYTPPAKSILAPPQYLKTH